ncbi:phosphoribosylanthranilate isomerase [Saccharothrix tamanrassetensis]|uniref:N-(5'-phosphoribosyl)anthranilate isomerase n=1 Tax=Saccharothrix tamanrassetensis TaxID=1051531 RepID=A0A841CRC4_9PSEU|nr:phosphoribosylanthranilate isomerase [Saccharothrix tamanrassetensis]MBB5958046.1 phosphoribosylanthranilate isomerase [Saccharothrix tamanrassetensis]
MYVKLCGLRTTADVAVAVDAGADAVGIVFTESPRQVDPDTARRLVREVPPHVLSVGVFKGIAADEVRRLAAEAGVDAVQLHGRYPQAAFEEVSALGVPLVRAVTLTSDTDVRVGAYGEQMLLLDSPVAGSGEQWDTTALDGARPEGRWLLAGGLGVDNVAGAVSRARPWGVDVSSGIESSRGVKDHGLMREFVAAARAAAPHSPS